MQDKWHQCLEKLETEVAHQKFKPWIKPLQYIGYDESEDTLRLGLGSVLKLNMVKENFLSTIQTAVRQIFTPATLVALEVHSASRQAGLQAGTGFARTLKPLDPEALKSAEQDDPAAGDTDNEAPRQLDLGGRMAGIGNRQGNRPADSEPVSGQTPELPFSDNEAKLPADEPQPKVQASQNGNVRLIPEFTFDSLVDGKSNQMAMSAAMRVVEIPGKAYNPLFLYGGVGLGKTHILNAIGNAYLRRKPNARICYLHAQTYFDEMVLAIQRRTPHEFKRKYQSLDLLLIDDIQFLSNRERTQEEFFYTFEALLAARKQMVITSDTYPKELSSFQERLRSRFGSGLIVEIEPPELELRVAILRKKGEQLVRERPEYPPLNDKVALFIAQQVRSNVRDLEGALTRTLAFAMFHNLELTEDVARDACRDLFRPRTRLVSIETIQKTVAEFYSIRAADMYSKRRPANIARARQVAMYLCKELTNKSYPEIGDAFGGRDHTTVMHAVKRITALRATDSELNRQVHTLQQMLTE